MTIVTKLKDWLAAKSEPQSDHGSDRENVQLASALLMLEVGKADFNLSADEIETIKQALVKQFDLSQQDAEAFLRFALEEFEQTVSAHTLIRTLNEKLSNQEKIKLLEGLWQIALIDSQLDKYEEYHIRKIADWLYLPHSDFVRAKLKVLERI